MSVINKKPIIKTVLESLTGTQAGALASLLDGGAGATIKRTPASITTDDKGVNRCLLQVKWGLLTGYLLYTDDICAFVAYRDDQALDLYIIEDGNAKHVNEPLDIVELRSELDDSPESEEAEIVKTVNDAITAGDINIPAGIEVVELTTASGTLSDADYAKVIGDNCIIKYDSKYNLQKSYEDASKIVYTMIPISVTGNDITQGQITITKSDKSYLYGIVTNKSGTHLFKHTIVFDEKEGGSVIDTWSITIITPISTPLTSSPTPSLDELDIIKATLLNGNALKEYHPLWLTYSPGQFNGYGFESEDSGAFEDIIITGVVQSDTVTSL